MTMRPGFPESGGFAGRFKSIEQRLVALERATRLTSASIGSGGLTVKDDGKIQFVAADETVILELDRSALTYHRANGSRILEITPAGGLKIYAANGTTEKLVLDGSGLEIDGIVQPALAVLADTDSPNPTITTSESTINEVTLPIPSWADEVSLITYARLQVSNVSGSTRNMTNKLVNDVGGLDETTDDTWTIPHNETLSSFVALPTTVSNPGSSVTCRQRGSTTGGSHNGEARLEVLAIVRRTS